MGTTVEEKSKEEIVDDDSESESVCTGNVIRFVTQVREMMTIIIKPSGGI
jgi:hypothetical protein